MIRIPLTAPIVLATTLLAAGATPAATAQAALPPPDAGDRSVMARHLAGDERGPDGRGHAFHDRSMFAIAPPELRSFKVHDLVQIIVRETSRAESTQEVESKKDYGLDASVSAWPDLNLADLLDLRLFAGRTTNLPRVGVDSQKDFKGEGDYKREDDLTARLSAEIIDILPNGNLVLEARTRIQTDEETSAISVTGVCRPLDVTSANTVLSSQMHDLKVTKMHEGELREASKKGILARILDTIFSF